MSITLTDIQAARATIAGAVLRTPMLPSRKLSDLTQAQVFVKYENLQVTNSFKERGALNKLASLTAAERASGVIAVSAGNHAQAVAYHARRLSIPATIVMPVTTPHVKVAATQDHGAEVVLHGDTLDASFERAQALAAERGLTWVHPYDDALVIAGQGTAALEMLEDFPEIDTLVVPLGGGGLVSGMAVAAHALRPEMTIVAAEAALYPPFDNALKNRARPVGGPTLAEGIAVKSVGELTLPLVREHVAEVILVDESHLERAVNAFLTLQKVIAEGAGAAGLAAMLAAPELFRGRKVGLILSGGNIDPRILASVMLRELERESRIVSFRLSLDDRPGVLGRIATRLGALGANILEVDHRRQFLDVPAKGARLDVTVEARGAAHADAILAALADEGFDPQRIAAGAALE